MDILNRNCSLLPLLQKVQRQNKDRCIHLTARVQIYNVCWEFFLKINPLQLPTVINECCPLSDLSLIIFHMILFSAHSFVFLAICLLRGNTFRGNWKQERNTFIRKYIYVKIYPKCEENFFFKAENGGRVSYRKGARLSVFHLACLWRSHVFPVRPWFLTILSCKETAALAQPSVILSRQLWGV